MKTTVPELTNINSNPSQKPHYKLDSHYIGLSKTRVRTLWKTSHIKKLNVRYSAPEGTAKTIHSLKEASFDSGTTFTFIDEQLTLLKIKPTDTFEIVFTLNLDIKPSVPFVLKMMSYPASEAVAGIMIIAGAVALISALIALIPVIATTLATIGLTSTALAITGGILGGIGLGLAWANSLTCKMLINAPKTFEFNATMEVSGHPKSKMELNAATKAILKDRFFQEVINEFNSDCLNPEEHLVPC